MDNIHLHLVPKLRMTGAEHLLPLPAFMARTDTASSFYIFKPIVNADTRSSRAAASNLLVTAQHNASVTYCIRQKQATVCKKSGSAFLSNVPRYPKCTAFCKVPRLRTFFLLLRSKCEWRYVRSIGGEVLTEESRNTGRKNSQFHFVHHKSHTDWAWFERIINTKSVQRSKHSPSQLQKPTSQCCSVK